VGGVWFTIAVAAVAAVAAIELSRIMSGSRSLTESAIVAVPVVALVVIAYYVPVSGNVAPILVSMSAVVSVISMAWLLRARPTGSFQAGLAPTLATICLVAGTLLHAPILRELEHGYEWIMYLLTVTFAFDTGAFLVGTTFGRTHLAPRISPGKTWEGATGGLLSSIATSLGIVSLLSMEMSVLQAIGTGAGLGVIAQIGDLAESRLKRLGGAEDSGKMVPGHGGVMDRLDSIVWNLVVVYHFVS